MDAYICKRVKAKDQGTVFLKEGRVLFGNGRIVPAEHFRVGGPALGIAAVIQKTSHRMGIGCLIIGRLVEMPGVTLMGKGGEKGQVIGHMSPVDVDDIFLGVVNGRGSYKKPGLHILSETPGHI